MTEIRSATQSEPVRTPPTTSATRTTATTVHVLHTGTVNVDRALAFRERTWHPAPYTGWLRPRSARIELPVSAYLIEHPDGPTLVDTGWHAEMRTDQRAHLGRLASSMYSGRLPDGKAVHEQLAGLGFDPGDLRFVVLSHLHSDHVSGLEHVADAERILVSRPEWEARRSFGYVPSMWDGIDVDAFDLEDVPFGPHHRGLDLYGDGSVLLVFTPGHSRGHVSVLARTASGWVLLAGDVGYASRSWEEGVLPGVTTSDAEMDASLSWVDSVAAREDCLVALATHDPDVSPVSLG